MAGLRKPSPGPSSQPGPEEQESSAEAVEQAPAESTGEAAREPDTQVDALTGAPTSGEAEASAAQSAPIADESAATVESSDADSGQVAVSTTDGASTTATASTTEDPATADGASSASAPAGARPSPRPKSRDAGIQKPDGSTTPSVPERTPAGQGSRAGRQASGESTPAAGDATSPERKRYLLAGVFTVVAVLLIGLAVFFKVQGGQASSVTSNSALIDPARTAEAKQAATGAVESLFSYDFNNIGQTEDAAKNLLATDQVRDEYNKEFAEVKRLAPDQKMLVTSKVTRSAVIMLDGDRAKVLTFIDQTSTRTDQNKTSAGGSQLAVTMHKQDGTWKVTGMDAYSAGQQAGNEQAPAGQGAPG